MFKAKLNSFRSHFNDWPRPIKNRVIIKILSGKEIQVHGFGGIPQHWDFVVKIVNGSFSSDGFKYGRDDMFKVKRDQITVPSIYEIMKERINEIN